MKRSRKNSRRRLKNCACALLTAGACWNYLASCGVTERAEVTRIVLPKEEMAREAGAAAAGQEGLENAALPVPGILSCMIWDVPHIYQYDSYPTGCESVSAVCALRYSGADISVDTFIDRYLVKGSLGEKPEGGLVGPSLEDAFVGDPRTVHGCGCNAPVIVRAARRVLEGTDREVLNRTGAGLDTLCRDYVSRDIPVIIWATIHMQAWTNTVTWEDQDRGDTVTFYTAEHCLVLTGFDEENYYFSDPASRTEVTGYSRESVEAAYEKLGKQAVVIVGEDDR